jgi:methionyl-tRNA synthetase
MHKPPFYITSTLPYVNARPHLGFAAELVRADIIARLQATRGKEVFFNTGTDEHGSKLYEAAQAEDIPTQEYVDRYAAEFQKLKQQLGLFPDIHFIRTTDEHHKNAAQTFWKKVADNGYIYKKQYQTKYCVGCELEKTDSELEGGKCPLHPNKDVQLVDEENYFFKWSAFEKQLLAHYAVHPQFVVPDYRMNEIRAFVERGLQDFSISRLSSKMPWGVPVPGDSEHVMYVWFDALINYISTLGWPENTEQFEQFWRDGTPLQVAGKDNLRQQSAMWQAMLMAAGLPPTHTCAIFGFVTGEGGVKMSKSLGNVIEPFEITATYGIEALRYFIARHIHTFSDSPVSFERIHDAYTAGLVNGLGNQVARIMKLATTHLDKPVELRSEDTQLTSAFIEKMDAFLIHEAHELVWESIKKIDEYITETAPFKLIKSENPDDVERAKTILVELVRHVVFIATHVQFAMPNTAEKILNAVHTHTMPESLFPRIEIPAKVSVV